MKKIIYITLLFVLSCSSSGESEKLIEAGILEGHTGTGRVTLNFILPEGISPYDIILESSLDNEKFDDLGSIGTNLTFVYTNLTNEQSYYFRFRYKDQDKKKSEFSNVLELMPTQGYTLIEDAWALYFTDVNASYELFSDIIDYNLTARYFAYVGRGWATLKIVDGDKTNLEMLNAAKDDFEENIGDKDAKAGAIINYLLLDDFANSAKNFLSLSSNTSYVHKYISTIDNYYLRIHASIAHWFLNDFDKVNTYLNSLDSSNSPHNLSREEQIVKLQSLLSSLEKPTKSRK